jgi:dTDP-4-dehydrorhamnose 3,5-epimerase-like enzyme
MTKIQKLKINHKDKRGFIFDVFTRSPKEHCSIITFKKNSVRGNHYHKISKQFSLILEGKFEVFYSKISKNGNIIGKIEKKIVSERYLITHPSYNIHTFKCISNTGTMLAFACGLRGGKNYENDTFRIKLI